MTIVGSHNTRFGFAPRVHCEGSHTAAASVIDSGHGVCTVCGEVRMIYDSSKRGRGIMVDHERPAEVAVGSTP